MEKLMGCDKDTLTRKAKAVYAKQKKEFIHYFP